MRLRVRVLAAVAALAVVLGPTVPAHADKPHTPDDLPHLSTPEAEDFEAAAEELPAGMVEAIERDLGIDAATYLAESQAAVEGAELVTALEEEGIEVTGSEIDGTDFTVYLADASDIPAVESTGARAELRERAPSVSDIEVEAYDDLYSGSPWGYRIGSTTYSTCSIGLAGYNTNGDDLVATAGHCFGIGSSATNITQYTERASDPRSGTIDKPRQFGGSLAWTDTIGTLVSGSKEFGNGYDAALLATQASTAIARPQVARWGATATEDGQNDPLSSQALQLTGTTAGTVGADLCKSGYRTGWTCGEITAVDESVNVSGQFVNSIESLACMLAGDSGGVAVIGTAAAGINSGGGFEEEMGDGYCLYDDDPNDGKYNDYSYFFHVIDPSTGDGDDKSLTKKYGSSWTLCTGPVPFVASLNPGGDPDGTIPLKGKVPCAIAGVTTTVSLYLDGSASAYATATPSGSRGAFEFSLDGLPVGAHDYEIVASWDGNDSAPAAGSFDIFGADDLPSRLYGSDRYATAAAIAGEWDQSFDADVVFVATGENYPDALSAAAAAVYVGAPVLLTKKDSLPSVVKSRLNALHPDRIVVLGSTAAISSNVFNALKTVSGSPTVTRFSGSDRYDTMRKVVGFAFDDGAGGLVDVPFVVIATGKNFPDALSAGPGVARDGGAVILVDGSSSSIPSATMSVIKGLDPDRVIIAGSTAAVTTGIEAQLKKLYGGGVVTRVSGSDRYATSRLLTDYFWGDAPAVFFAVGTNYPDALAGAALAGALGAPLIVTAKSCMSSSTKSLVLALDAEERVLLGSSTVISSNVASLAVC